MLEQLRHTPEQGYGFGRREISIIRDDKIPVLLKVVTAWSQIDCFGHGVFPALESVNQVVIDVGTEHVDEEALDGWFDERFDV